MNGREGEIPVSAWQQKPLRETAGNLKTLA